MKYEQPKKISICFNTYTNNAIRPTPKISIFFMYMRFVSLLWSNFLRWVFLKRQNRTPVEISISITQYTFLFHALILKILQRYFHVTPKCVYMWRKKTKKVWKVGIFTKKLNKFCQFVDHAQKKFIRRQNDVLVCMYGWKLLFTSFSVLFSTSLLHVL